MPDNAHPTPDATRAERMACRPWRRDRARRARQSLPARERSDRQPVATSGRETNFDRRYGRLPGSVS